MNRKQVAKILKYFGFEKSCNIAFGIFLLTWFVARHIVYPALCWSISQHLPVQIKTGCYSGATAEMFTTDGYPNRWTYFLYPFRDMNGPICMNGLIMWIFISALLLLQVLSIIWFGMIARVAISVIRTGNAEDTRSDDEEGEAQEDEEEFEGRAAGKETSRGSPGLADSSGSEHSWRRSNGSVRAHRGRGRVRLGDQSDRKALLGRIGCDKPT